MVAAFRNLDVGHVAGGEAEARRGVVRNEARLGGDGVEGLVTQWTIENLSHDGAHFRDLVQTDEGIHFGQEPGQALVCVTGDVESLGEASRYDDLLLFTGGVFLSRVDRLNDGLHGLFLGYVDEGAGVDDEDIGEIRFRGHDHSLLLEVSDHDLGIDQVLGTAKGDKTDLSGQNYSGVVDGPLPGGGV